MLNHLTTEARNPASCQIDTLSALEIVRLMNSEDARVAGAVGAQAAEIARAIEVIAERLRRGGRLIYMGAGTSGRLGVLDASECPPTFNSPPGQVVGLIAGGYTALTRAVEGAEDHPEMAVEDLANVNLQADDVVVGIASSGRTPYVIGGLQHARRSGAFAIALCCNADSSIAAEADLTIAPVVGPEVISGSTRLKAGTATKMVLNMLTTGAMVLLGKTYGNLMVDLRATNSKLRARAQRITAQLTGLDDQAAGELLARCDGELKTAIVVHSQQVDPAEARRLIAAAGGRLRAAMYDSTAESQRQVVVHDDLLLGIDGGGTGTTALLARRFLEGSEAPIGRGESGPSNPRAVGFAAAQAALDEAIARAFADAGLPVAPVAAACIAVAGAARESERRELDRWASSRRLATHCVQVHDALPVLAAGTRAGWGIALIAGTGSMAFGRNAEGMTARAGGWGYLIGDEGSGYSIAVQGLRAVSHALDGRGPRTVLVDRYFAALAISDAAQLVPALYEGQRDRMQIAALAGLVTEAAALGDAVAGSLLGNAANDLATMVASVARQLQLGERRFPLALAGGLLLGSELLRAQVEAAIAQQGFVAETIQLVAEPALGCIEIARAAALK